MKTLRQSPAPPPPCPVRAAEVGLYGRDAERAVLELWPQVWRLGEVGRRLEQSFAAKPSPLVVARVG